MSSGWQISMDTEDPAAVPYFNWDAPVTNGDLRRTLREGTEEDRLYWIGRILREAQYWDVWRYISLRRDLVPRWDALRNRLGRRRAFWEFLIEGWRQDGIL
jgi:hypothetical protein